MHTDRFPMAPDSFCTMPAYELERCVVPFAKVRLVVNGEVMVDIMKELLEYNPFK